MGRVVRRLVVGIVILVAVVAAAGPVRAQGAGATGSSAEVAALEEQIRTIFESVPYGTDPSAAMTKASEICEQALIDGLITQEQMDEIVRAAIEAYIEQCRTALEEARAGGAQPGFVCPSAEELETAFYDAYESQLAASAGAAGLGAFPPGRGSVPETPSAPPGGGPATGAATTGAATGGVVAAAARGTGVPGTGELEEFEAKVNALLADLAFGTDPTETMEKIAVECEVALQSAPYADIEAIVDEALARYVQECQQARTEKAAQNETPPDCPTFDELKVAFLNALSTTLARGPSQTFPQPSTNFVDTPNVVSTVESNDCDQASPISCTQ